MTWPTERLAGHCEVITKGTTPTTLGHEFTESGVPFLRVQNIGGGTVTLDQNTLFIDESTHRILERSQICPGDVLVSIAGTIGRVGVVPEDVPPLNCNQAVAIVRPKKDIHRPFLRHWLESFAAQAQMRGATVTGTISNLSLAQLGNLKVPLPPLPEQRRIAEILDKADALRVKRRAALAQLDTLAKSIFFEIFGEKLGAPAVDTKPHYASVPRGCSWILLTDVARLATGHTPDRERAEYWNGDIPWISLTDIRSLDGTEATSTLQNITPLGIQNSSSVLLPKGTVCFSRTASVGFATVMGREMATSQDFMNWVCGPLLDPTYLMWALITSRQRLLSLAPGSTHRTIYMRVVEQFRVLLPPIESQLRFVRRVARINEVKKSMRASVAELDCLFASLQQCAFLGEL